MTFLGKIKSGFAYGLGGRLGWEVGGFFWGLIRKTVIIVCAFAGLSYLSEGIPKYAKKVEVQQQKDKAKQVSYSKNETGRK